MLLGIREGFWRVVPAHVVKSVFGLASITDLAKLVGKPVTSLRWWIEEGRIPAPSFIVKRAAYYTADECRKIVIYFNTRVASGVSGKIGVRKAKKAEVAEMRRLWLAGEGQPKIAELFGVSQGTVSRLIRGDS